MTWGLHQQNMLASKERGARSEESIKSPPLCELQSATFEEQTLKPISTQETKLELDPARDLNLIEIGGMYEREFFNTIEEAMKLHDTIVEEPGIGIWVATNKDSSKADPLIPRWAIHIPTIDRHGESISPKTIHRFLNAAHDIGLQQQSKATGHWKIESSSTSQSEQLLILSSNQPIYRGALKELASRIMIEANQDATSFEVKGELVQLRTRSRVMLTGGSGDLGTMLSNQLSADSMIPFRIDPLPPRENIGVYAKGSLLEDNLIPIFRNVDCIVHIAGWHGIHQERHEKSRNEFWELNVQGTINTLEAAKQAGVNKVVFISSSSVINGAGIYSQTKRVAEAVVKGFAEQEDMSVITLRPHGFIPCWNRSVYDSYEKWLNWFSKGAVHINDISQAVIKSIDILHNEPTGCSYHEYLIDGKYDYHDCDLANWDEHGPGSTFQEYYPELIAKAEAYGLDVSIKPNILGSNCAEIDLGYKATIGIREALELGPPS